MTCCAGPGQSVITWLACGAEDPATIAGYAGMTKMERTENCAIQQVVWTTGDWPADETPSLGDQIQVSGVSWFVDGTSQAGCAVVLRLCRPVVPCPDCQVNVYRLERGAATPELCAEDLEEAIIAADVNATVCVLGQQRKLVNNAEIVSTTARICLDESFTLQPGDLVVCTPNAWRVEKIASPCSAKCLLTVEAILEPWGLHVEAEE
jgi:hypothetical protein